MCYRISRAANKWHLHHSHGKHLHALAGKQMDALHASMRTCSCSAILLMRGIRSFSKERKASAFRPCSWTHHPSTAPSSSAVFSPWPAAFASTFSLVAGLDAGVGVVSHWSFWIAWKMIYAWTRLSRSAELWTQKCFLVSGPIPLIWQCLEFVGRPNVYGV